MISFSEKVCQQLEGGLRREWLETNGIGGFASATINGCNTRRYHGLLVAATKPPVGRLVVLSKLEETLVINGGRFELSTNSYPGAIHPQGFHFLKQFRLDPFPVFTFEVDGTIIEKTVFMVAGENTTVIEYRLLDGAEAELELRPLVAFRDYHSLTHENGAINANVESRDGVLTLSPYQGLPDLHLGNNATQVQNTGDWYRSFQYEAERERGLDYTEDLFNPCVLHFELSSGPAIVIASTERREASLAGGFREAEVQRRSPVQIATPSSQLTRTLETCERQRRVLDQERRRYEELRAVEAGRDERLKAQERLGQARTELAEELARKEAALSAFSELDADPSCKARWKSSRDAAKARLGAFGIQTGLLSNVPLVGEYVSSVV